MTNEERSQDRERKRFWHERGKALLHDYKASGSELRAAAIGVRGMDAKLAEQLESKARIEIARFNQKHK
tara:strand:+ start:7329 stop:7535 length:207 start_codon:yes stop_codon:yes gene_type:complete